MYAITGATGHIGKRIAEILLNTGAKVIAIGRSEERLEALAGLGASPAVGSLEDAAFLARAFAVADGVFAMIPPNNQADDFRAYQNRIGARIAEAVKASGVRYVVSLSSQGAHLPTDTGLIGGLYDQEQRLNKLPGLNVLHLRPAFFMENLLPNAELIQAQGINGTPLRGDLRFPVIATRDIARVAAGRLTALDFTGRSVQDLLGPRDLTMIEMTRMLGAAIGKPDLEYVQFPPDTARQAMIDLGASPDVASLFVEMCDALNTGRIMNGIRRTADNTTETRFEDFARQFARVYASAAPVAAMAGAAESV